MERDREKIFFSKLLLNVVMPNDFNRLLGRFPVFTLSRSCVPTDPRYLGACFGAQSAWNEIEKKIFFQNFC